MNNRLRQSDINDLELEKKINLSLDIILKILKIWLIGFGLICVACLLSLALGNLASLKLFDSLAIILAWIIVGLLFLPLLIGVYLFFWLGDAIYNNHYNNQ